MSDKVSFISMNVQGLADKRKRLDVFNYIKGKNPSIIFLQDTHFTKSVENVIYSEIDMKCFFNHFTSQSRGVAIFINNKIDFQLNSEFKDENGNLLILNCNIYGKTLNLVNLYGPNKDDPYFFKLINNTIRKSDNQAIIAGDFNLILNPDIDCFDYVNNNHHPKARDEVLYLINDNDLVDCWRDSNIETKQYTWFKKNTNKKARLDFFLISNTLMIIVKKG